MAPGTSGRALSASLAGTAPGTRPLQRGELPPAARPGSAPDTRPLRGELLPATSAGAAPVARPPKEELPLAVLQTLGHPEAQGLASWQADVLASGPMGGPTSGEGGRPAGSGRPDPRGMVQVTGRTEAPVTRPLRRGELLPASLAGTAPVTRPLRRVEPDPDRSLGVAASWGSPPASQRSPSPATSASLAAALAAAGREPTSEPAAALDSSGQTPPAPRTRAGPKTRSSPVPARAGPSGLALGWTRMGGRASAAAPTAAARRAAGREQDQSLLTFAPVGAAASPPAAPGDQRR